MLATSLQRVVKFSTLSQPKLNGNKHEPTAFNIHPFGVFQVASIACHVAFYPRFPRIGKDNVPTGGKFFRFRDLGILFLSVRLLQVSFQGNEQTLGNTVRNPIGK